MKTFAPASELRALEKLRDAELEEARALQSVMLPRESLRARGVTISQQFQPVSAVGGDFLDYFELSDGCIGLYLGDISGKGLPAAFFGALAVGTLRGVHKTGTPADQVLATMNRRLMIRGLPTRHAALQYAVFNPSNQLFGIKVCKTEAKRDCGNKHRTGTYMRVPKQECSDCASLSGFPIDTVDPLR